LNHRLARPVAILHWHYFAINLQRLQFKGRKMQKTHRQSLLIAALLAGTALVVAGCNRQPEAQVARAPATMPWAQFVEQFIEHYLQAHPTFAVSAGRHEFDGRMPDWSRAGIERDIAHLHQQRIAASTYNPALLAPRERFERDYLIARVDRDLFWLEKAQAPFRNPQFYFGAIDSIDPAVYVTRPYASLEKRAEAFIRYAEGIPSVANQIRANLSSPLSATYVSYGVAGFAGLADFYRNDVPTAFVGVDDPALKSQLLTAIEPAAAAMQELADWLKSTETGATQDYALGPKLFADMLWMTERVDTPLDRLEAVGRTDLARNLAALKGACARYAPRLTIEKCVAKVRQNKAEGGVIAGAQKQLAELQQFVIDQQVVTIPGAEQATVDQAPSYNAQNSAYIDIPGAYDKGMPSIYYIAAPDKTWSPAEQAAYIAPKASLLFTSVHEVWPGHFLQSLHSNRSSSRLGQLFVGYAFAEGWAHYAEEMMLEMGLSDGDPETHIGQLMQALLRDVRFISAIGLHTKGMSVAESEKLFREQAYQDAGRARQQAARGTRDPAYLNYTLGKLMIRKLRQDWTATRNGNERASWREFHDALLSYGGPPIPLVRTQILQHNDGSLF
jgi:uncharacterized protein (DUF885 family)